MHAERAASRLVKRIMDVACATLSLLLFAPVMLLVALLLLVMNGRPVVFAQSRPGLHGQLFTLRKFRTMSSRLAGDGMPLPDEDRLTRFGRLLRMTSIDELPTLWNVLIGDMSLVGPRPLLVEYLPLYSKEQARRHEVRPGITGWAQVNGRNAISWDQKFAYDVWYVDHWSLALDLRILAMTVVYVVCARGISQEGQATGGALSWERTLKLLVAGAGGHGQWSPTALATHGRLRGDCVVDDGFLRRAPSRVAGRRMLAGLRKLSSAFQAFAAGLADPET